jgi:hypothetical protein
VRVETEMREQERSNGQVRALRVVHGHFECVACGAAVPVDSEADVQVTIVAAGGMPNRRRLTIDGVEVHSCEYTPKASSSRRDPFG